MTKRQLEEDDDNDNFKWNRISCHEYTSVDKKWNLCQLVHSVMLYGLLAIMCSQTLDILRLYAVERAHLLECQRKSLIRLNASPKRERKNWHIFVSTISDLHFRRMFRMSRSCFNELCCCIENHVGHESFCSQDFISTELEHGNSRLANIYRAHKETSGGFVCGEVKLAITLRILGGGSYLDIACIFNVTPNQVYPIFHKVLLEWICNDGIARYTLKDIIQDEDEMYKVASHFAEGRSGGILAGVVGALDGWLVKIECPSMKKDGVENPGGYFSRKGFYALNVQAIVDKKKRILWMYLGAKGGEHDSAAFKSSNLYEILENMFLDSNGTMHKNHMNIPFYVIGDSAYSLRPFLMVPFDNALPHSAEDTFNFILSSSRINVECAFGEIDARWGIFWRPLKFDLDKQRNIIDASFRLHNFILDHKERNNVAQDDDMDLFSKQCLSFVTTHPEEIVGCFGNGSLGDDEPKSRGRPTNIEQSMREAGVRLRDRLKDKMKEAQLSRPSKNSWYTDECNHTRVMLQS